MCIRDRDTGTSKLYDELLADMMLRPHWARSASPPGPDPGHKSPLSSVPPWLPSLPKCDGIALRCLMCLPYEHCMTMNYSIGPSIRNTYLSEPQTLSCWPNAWPLSKIRSLFRPRFRIAFILHVYFERVFSYWRRLFWRVPPASNAPSPGSRNEDCRQQSPATDYVTRSGPTSMLLSYKYKK